MARKTVQPSHQAKVSQRGNSEAQSTSRKRGRESTSLLPRTAKRPRTRNQERQASPSKLNRPKRSRQTKPPRHLVPPPIPWWKLSGFSSEEEATRTYFDKLPPVPPYRRLLEEHDRRNEDSTSRVSLSPVTCPLQSVDILHPGFELKRYSRGGGPDLTYLRGFKGDIDIPAMPASSSQTPRDSNGTSRQRSKSQVSRKTGNTRVTRKDGLNTEGDATSNAKTGSTHVNLIELNIILSGIYPEGYEDDGKPFDNPVNMDELRDIAMRENPTTPVGKEQQAEVFSKHQGLVFKAKTQNETFVKTHLWLNFTGNERSAIALGAEQKTNNLSPFVIPVGINRRFDYVESAPFNQLEWVFKLSNNSELVSTLFPHKPYSWAVPNFTAELKSPKGDMHKAGCQASLAGAIGARAMQNLRMLGRPESFCRYDKKAYSISAVYNGIELLILAVHQAEPKQGSLNPIYITTLIGSYYTFRRPGDLIEGIRAIRNLSDWCQKQRDTFINEARERALLSAMRIGRDIQPTPPSSVRSSSSRNEPSEESSDDDSESRSQDETDEESEDELLLDEPDLATSFSGSQISDLSTSSAQSSDSQKTLMPPPRNKRKASPKLAERKSEPRQNKRKRRYTEYHDEDDDDGVDLINDD